jgi:hypothetical protein
MNSDLKHRLGGLLCIAGGIGVGWWGIWKPYQAALAHAPEVEYHSKIFILVPALLVFGLFFALFGDRVAYRNAEKQSLTVAGWALFAIVAVISGLALWWFLNLFSELGYRNS